MSEMVTPRINSEKTLTREGLQEILKVNFQLYKDEPDFFEYITTLVIYLMQYEFRDEAMPDQAAPGSMPAPGMVPAQPQQGHPRLQKYHSVSTRYKVLDGRCPQCNNTVPKDRNICPYCLAMIEQ